MRLLIIDAGAHALDFAMRAQAQGHEVKWFKRYKERSELVGKGLVEVVNDFNPWLRWANLIFVTDNTYYLRQLDSVRRQEGVLMVGATEESAAWEIDRSKGQAILKACGITALPSKEFTDYDQAIAYVKREDRRFVSKPCGITEDKALSYVSQSPEDLVYMLQRWKKLSKHKAPFILQDFVPGIEMAVGGWFGPGGFNEGYCENWEFKKLMNDNLGVGTGEQGTVLRYVRRSKLADRVLLPLSEELARSGHSGYVDVNCIVDDKGTPWPLEFTCRPGWPTFQIQHALHQGDCVEWLMELARGYDAHPNIYNSVSVGVVMTIPDYPYSQNTKKEITGIPIYGLTDGLMKHVHPCEMMLGESVPQKVGDKIVDQQMLVTAGDYVLVMTATNLMVKSAALTCYRRLERLNVPNSPMYRTDIGKRLAKDLPKLQSLGYAKGMLYSPTE